MKILTSTFTILLTVLLAAPAIAAPLVTKGGPSWQLVPSGGDGDNLAERNEVQGRRDGNAVAKRCLVCFNNRFDTECWDSDDC
jgi:hypothetical protein